MFEFDVESLRIEEATNRLDGLFETEKHSCAVFDSYLDRQELFQVHREVNGFYIHPRPGTEHSEARIDRILVPRTSAIKRGWSGGIIGVEIKKSGGTIGPAITQALDYSRCAFVLSGECLVIPSWVFVFPMRNPLKAAESVMSNNRIGQCHAYDYPGNEQLRFVSGSIIIMKIMPDGSVPILKVPNHGNKRGHRSPQSK